MAEEIDTQHQVIAVSTNGNEILLEVADSERALKARGSLTVVQAERLADAIYRAIKEIDEPKHDHDDSVDWTAP